MFRLLVIAAGFAVLAAGCTNQVQNYCGVIIDKQVQVHDCYESSHGHIVIVDSNTYYKMNIPVSRSLYDVAAIGDTTCFLVEVYE